MLGRGLKHGAGARPGGQQAGTHPSYTARFYITGHSERPASPLVVSLTDSNPFRMLPQLQIEPFHTHKKSAIYSTAPLFKLV